MEIKVSYSETIPRHQRQIIDLIQLARLFDVTKTTSTQEGASQKESFKTTMAVGEGGRDNGVKELIKTTTALGSTTIDLSRKNLTEIPPEVLELQQLEFLYVEGNFLTIIPDYLFEKLPNLKWLDLRNNHLTEVPAAIGSHKSIRNLLLEGNDIKELPLELGFAKLSGLNLASNPLEMPPSSVIEKGTQEVLKFLRDKYASKVELTEKQTVLGVRSASASSSEEDLLYSSDNQSKENTPRSRLTRRKSTGDPADPDLRPTLTPVPFHQNPPSRPDQVRMEYDRKRAQRHSAEHVRKDSWSKEPSTSADYPKRPSRPVIKKKQNSAIDRLKYDSSASPRFPNYEAKAVEQQHLAITAMLNEKEDTILQKLKDKKALSDWRDKTRKLRQQKQHLATFKKPPKVDVNAPYGTEKNMKEEKPNAKYIAKLKEILDDKDKDAVKRALRDRELEGRIRTHLEKVQEHRRKTYDDVSDELSSARRNLEIAHNYHKELDERRALEYRLRAFTGDEIPLARGHIHVPDITKKKK